MKSSHPRSTTRRVFTLLACLMFVVALLHGHAGGPALFEDERGSAFHPQHLAALATGQGQQVFRPARTEADRPLARWIYAWWLPADGAPPTGLGRAAVLVHAFTTGLLFLLFRRLGSGTPGAVCAALLFGIHPMVVEPVAWLSANGRLGAGCFSVAALFFWLGGKGSRLFALVFLALAVASHTAAAPLGLVFLALDRLGPAENPGHGRRRPGNDLMFVLPALTLGILGWLLASAGRDPVGFSMRVLHGAREVWVFLFHAVVPTRSGAIATHPALAGSGPPLAVLAWIAVGCSLGLGIRGLLRGSRAALGWLWFLCLALGAALPTPVETSGRDAAAYLALPGLAFAAVALGERGLRRLPGLRLSVGILVIAGLAGAGALAWGRVLVWRSPLRVLERALARSGGTAPGSGPNFVVETLLGREHLWRGKLFLADAYFRSALETEPGYAPALLGRGLLALQRDDRAAARACLQAALDVDAQQARALERLAEVHIREGGREAYGVAADSLRAALEVAPAFAHAHARLASLLALLALGPDDPRLSESKQHAERALSLDPHSREAWKALGEVHEKRGADARAIEAYQRSLAEEPDYSEALYKLGKLRLARGEVEEGLALLERTYFLHPLENKHAFSLAEAYDSAGKPSEAFEHYLLTVKQNPRHMRANEALGWFHVEAGNAQAALARAEHLLGINPGHIGGRRISGHAQLMLGRHTEALANLQLAAGSAPDDARLGALIALLLSALPEPELRDGQEALARARELALRTERRDAKVLQALAAAQAETGDFAAAIATTLETLAFPSERLPPGLRPVLGEALSAFRREEPLRLDISRPVAPGAGADRGNQGAGVER